MHLNPILIVRTQKKLCKLCNSYSCVSGNLSLWNAGSGGDAGDREGTREPQYRCHSVLQEHWEAAPRPQLIGELKLREMNLPPDPRFRLL